MAQKYEEAQTGVYLSALYIYSNVLHMYSLLFKSHQPFQATAPISLFFTSAYHIKIVAAILLSFNSQTLNSIKVVITRYRYHKPTNTPKMEMDPFFAMTEDSVMNYRKSSASENKKPPQPPPLPPPPKSSTSTTDLTDFAEEETTRSSKSKDDDDNTSASQESLDKIWTIMAKLLQEGQIEQTHVSIVQNLIRQNLQSKEKIAKLKNLLQRSAKAQKDSKAEVAGWKSKWEESQAEIKSLHSRIDTLANRPTHYLDLLTDFDSNFDRALLAMEERHQDTGEASVEPPKQEEEDMPQLPPPTENPLLVSQLHDMAKEREKLESLNSALVHRASKLEKQQEELREQLLAIETKCSQLQLELSDRKSQNTHLQMQLKDKTAALLEMQLEIDLVTKASVHANVRANEAAAHYYSHHSAPSVNPHVVAELEAKVTALTEWAMASAASKQLAVERVAELEERLRELHTQLQSVKRRNFDLGQGVADEEPIEGDTDAASDSPDDKPKERRLWKQGSSMVIGAGLTGSHIAQLDDDVVAQMATVSQDELVVLRWKFDLTPSDQDIYFSLFRGHCHNQPEWQNADALIRNKRVIGGGGGDVENAFTTHNACTLVWSNTHSWIRPRTVKFTIEAVVLTEIME